MDIHTFSGGYDSNFTYIVEDEGKAILIDPFVDARIDKFLEGVELKYIINTHTHFDHVEGNDHYKKKFGASIVTHEAGSVAADLKVKDRDQLEVGAQKITFLHTPGHTPESMCLLIGKDLFTGDTLFVGKVGGTSTEEQAKQEFDSLQNLMTLQDDIVIYPGHDYGVKPTSSIAREKKENPFILRKDFKDFLWLKQN